MKKPLPLIDRIMLGPIEEYEKGRFPWRFLMHIMVLIFSTLQIYLVVDNVVAYSRAENRIFYDLFFDEQIDGSEFDYTNSVKFHYTVSELYSHIKESIDNYYDIENIDTIERYRHIMYTNESDGKEFVSQPILSAYFIRERGREDFENVFYNLTVDNLGPFNQPDDNMRYFISNLTNFSILYEFKNFIPEHSMVPFECFRWEIRQDFDFSERNHLYERLKSSRFFCEGKFVKLLL